jgi:hypothetical protein
MYLVCSECRCDSDKLEDYAFQIAKIGVGPVGYHRNVRTDEEYISQLDSFLDHHDSCAAGNEQVFTVEYEETVYSKRNIEPLPSGPKELNLVLRNWSGKIPKPGERVTITDPDGISETWFFVEGDGRSMKLSSEPTV